MSTGVSPALQLPPIFIELGECQRRADAGDPEAQFQLGLRYMHGRQVDINRDKAVSWWTLAAKDRFRPGQLPAPGHPDAQCNLAVFLENKPGAAVAERLRAIELYQAAARQGHVNAMLNLADVYRSGRGVKRDDIWADRLVSQVRRIVL
jgi:TPR repeat protein